MKDSSASATGRAVAQLETIEKLSQSLVSVVKSLPGEKQDEKLLQLSLKFACINFSTLRKELEKDGADRAALENPGVHFEELLSQLSENEKKIQDFKISLADAVMENRDLSKKLHEKTEKCNDLATQVTQMQLHSKELALKLSTANETLTSRDLQIESSNREIQDTKTRNLQLKNQIAELEDHIAKLTTKLESTALKLSENELEMLKIHKDFGHVVNSNNSQKLEIEHLQIRTAELEEAIEALQREKNHLQDKLKKQLAGARRSIEYSIPQPLTEGSSVLEPSVLPAYLPFCFPERLPAPIRFRREIKKLWPASLRAAQKAVPVIFNDFGPATELKIPARMQLKMPDMVTVKRQRLDIKGCNFNPFCDSVKIVLPSHIVREINRFSINYAPLRARKDISAYLIKSESKELRIFSNARFMPRKIYTTSFDLYLANLMQNSPNLYLKNRKKQSFQVPRFGIDISELTHLKFANIFTEKLAFRHRFQLQSQKLLAPVPKFNCSFRRGNKLKSVLETFGNTISSMVQKYDIVVSPPAQNGGTAK